MLKKVLANFYAAITHEDKFLINILMHNDIYKIIAECEKGNENIYNLLEGQFVYRISTFKLILY